MDPVSFLTDYGLSDAFVAVCHGVLLRAAPAIRIVDVTHLVPPGDVRRGASVLAQAVGWLPRSVHLAVVDPGVGTARRPVALAAPGGLLVGPDNGLLIAAADVLGGPVAAVALPVPPGTPATFHGRDVFAPAAARLATGTPLAELGSPVDVAGLVRLPVPVARVVDGGLEAEVVWVDHFGNVALAAGADLLAAAGLRVGERVTVAGPDAPVTGMPGVSGAATAPGATGLGATGVPVQVGTTFGSVTPGDLVLYLDATGNAALAVNGGNAAARLTLTPGTLVRIVSTD